jgi:hypothetical protein
MVQRMPRLGELLVAAGLLTVEQVEQALRAQVLWGGRLGTNLVELHHLELDPLAKALGRQHRLPAALARHFEGADPELQQRLPVEIAERLSCVPLLRLGRGNHVAIASLAPLAPDQLAVVAEALGVEIGRLIPAIAAELRIRYQLERVYGVRRAARFLRAHGKSIPPFPAFQVPPGPPEPEPELPPNLAISTQETAALERSPEPVAPPAPDPDAPGMSGMLDDELAIPSDPAEDETSARERRTYVRTIADAPSPDAEAEAHALLARIAIRKVAIGSAPRIATTATLGEATRAIRRSTDRDRVAELVIDALDRFTPACEAAILLVVRGSTAIGWKGFQRAGGGPGEIAVPLEDGGLIPRAVERNASVRLASTELDALDALLLASLGQRTGDLVVVPIAIAGQVMCALALATASGAPVATAEPIAAAAGAAFARLIRDASR